MNMRHARGARNMAGIGAIGLLAILSLASCGGAMTTQGPAGSTGSPGASLGPGGPSGDPSGSEIVLERSGGIAGFHDTIRIAPDGSAEITGRNGVTGTCTPDPAALARLRAIDLAAVGSGPPKTPVADGFTYTVTSNGSVATAGDGDTQGVRAELVAAAAAVVTSCVNSMSHPEA